MTILIIAVALGVALNAKQEAAKPKPINDIVGEDPHSQGPADAVLTLTEFADYNCSHCYEFSKIIPQLLAAYPTQLRYVYRHFPLQGESGASFTLMLAAEAAHAQGKFWEFQELLWENYGQNTTDKLRTYAAQIGLDVTRFESDLANRTYRSRIVRDTDAADLLNLNGTPAFYLNNERYEGAYDFETFKQVIDRKLGST